MTNRTERIGKGELLSRLRRSRQAAEALAAWDRSYRRVVEVVEELTEADFAPGSSLEHALGDAR
jgi:hypothetical protein